MIHPLSSESRMWVRKIPYRGDGLKIKFIKRKVGIDSLDDMQEDFLAYHGSQRN